MSEEVKFYYANKCTVFSSEYDFQILFSRFSPAQDEEIDEFNKVIVGMSPKHAKKMITALEENIKKYEEQYGRINIK